jgi:mannose-6-phosphate isomerase-like protein (cupin superfamily)
VQPNVVRRNEGKQIYLGPTKLLVKEDGSFTRNTLSFIEVEVQSGFSLPPQHIHRGFEELFYILEGELEFNFGDETIYASSGDQITIPDGVPHTYGNKSGNSARLLIIHTNPMVKYFEEVEELIKQGVPPQQAVVLPTSKYNTEIA